MAIDEVRWVEIEIVTNSGYIGIYTCSIPIGGMP